jgi:hypothetical protein
MRGTSVSVMSTIAVVVLESAFAVTHQTAKISQTPTADTIHRIADGVVAAWFTRPESRMRARVGCPQVRA